MLGAWVIVFREVLEAALVIGVVAAAVQGLAHRGRRIAFGVALGLAGSAVVAAALGVISQFGAGRGQELLQATVLAIAGLMLIWHNLYMAAHGRALTQQLKALGREVLQGAAPATMIVGVTAIAVLREGSEVVLFLYALAAGGASQLGLLFGGLLGVASGAVVGYLLFLGLSRIPVRRLFQVSAWIMLFIAAGMLANAAMYLVQVDVLPALVRPLWDTSGWIAGGSLAGRTLAALAGYSPMPSLMQVLVWLATFVLVGGWMVVKDHKAMTPAATASPHTLSQARSSLHS